METKSNTTSSPVKSATLDYLLGDDALSSLQQDTSSIVNRAERSYQSNVKASEASRAFEVGRAEETALIDADTLTTQGAASRLNMRESRGLASSMAQFQVFDDTINKQMNQIQRSKDDAIRAADMTHYTRIANAEMNLIDTQIKATNSMFEKMFGIAGLSQQQQQIQLTQDAQAFQQEQAVGNIALEYGLKAIPGETISQAISRAAPLATGERKLKLQKMQAEINAENARISQINQQMSDARTKAKAVSSMTAEDLKKLKVAFPASYQSFVDEAASTGDRNITNMAYEVEQASMLENVKSLASTALKENLSREEAYKYAVEQLKNFGISNVEATANRAVLDVYGAPRTSTYAGNMSKNTLKLGVGSIANVLNPDKSPSKLAQTEYDSIVKENLGLTSSEKAKLKKQISSAYGGVSVK